MSEPETDRPSGRLLRPSIGFGIRLTPTSRRPHESRVGTDDEQSRDQRARHLRHETDSLFGLTSVYSNNTGLKVAAQTPPRRVRDLPYRLSPFGASIGIPDYSVFLSPPHAL
jgi:hypothetical protein